MSREDRFVPLLKKLIKAVQFLIFCVIGSSAFFISKELGLFQITPIFKVKSDAIEQPPTNTVPVTKLWQAPDTLSIPDNPEGSLIKYGRELIAHTAVYLGPNGKVSTISNGMNCQNCHLKAGTVPYGNNYGKVAATYPKLRNRSGTVEGFEKRVNDCIERSLNGEKLPEDSREMKAIVAYLKWVGKDVENTEDFQGFGLLSLPPLDRAADPVKGSVVYQNYCARCHGENGEGQLAPNGQEWTYPPLFGESSYNIGAGLYRLSRFAGYVKANMPYGITYENPFLTDEEAWDVAAYVNSMSRPQKDLSGDWPDVSKKPYDHPFGPYADNFPESQHKFGPFAPIIEAQQP